MRLNRSALSQQGRSWRLQYASSSCIIILGTVVVAACVLKFQSITRSGDDHDRQKVKLDQISKGDGMKRLLLISVGVAVASFGLAACETTGTRSESGGGGATAVASATTSSFNWDGAWGRTDNRGARVVVNGNNVQYFWNGERSQVTNVSRSNEELRFTAGRRNVVMTPARGGSATFTSNLPGEQPTSFTIWRP